jgi:hypothetical protein
VYGLHGAALPLLPGCGYVNLDAGLPSLAPLAGCLGVLLLAGDALDEREAAPRCALALALGKWVLASGFGDDGCAAPLELPGLDARALQTVAPKELAARLPLWLAELRLAPPGAAAGPLRSLLATALAPEAQLAGHVALLSQLAEPRRAVAAGHGAAKPPGQLGRLLRQLGRLLRRSERRVDGRK